MGVFQGFEIAQMVPNCATHHICIEKNIGKTFRVHFFGRLCRSKGIKTCVGVAPLDNKLYLNNDVGCLA